MDISVKPWNGGARDNGSTGFRPPKRRPSDEASPAQEDASASASRSAPLTFRDMSFALQRESLANATSLTQTQVGFLDAVEGALGRLQEISGFAGAAAVAGETDEYLQEFTQLQAYVSDLGSRTFDAATLFSARSVAVEDDAVTRRLSQELDPPLRSVVRQVMGAVERGGSPDAARRAGLPASAALGEAQAKLVSFRAHIDANLERLRRLGEVMAARDAAGAAKSISDPSVAQEDLQSARSVFQSASASAMSTQANILATSAMRLLGGS